MQSIEPIAEVVEAVLAEVRAKFKEASEHAGIIESLRAFAAAVDWREPWLVGLLVCEALLLVSVLVLRKNENFQFAVFISAAGLIYAAQYLNDFLGSHWKRFAGQAYFDPEGIFISAVLSGPLIFILFVQLVIFLLQCTRLLIEMKKAELLYKARKRAKEAKAGGQRMEPVETQKTK